MVSGEVVMIWNRQASDHSAPAPVQAFDVAAQHVLYSSKSSSVDNENKGKILQIVDSMHAKQKLRSLGNPKHQTCEHRTRIPKKIGKEIKTADTNVKIFSSQQKSSARARL